MNGKSIVFFSLFVILLFSGCIGSGIVMKKNYDSSVRTIALDGDRIILGLGGDKNNLIILDKYSGEIIKKISAHTSDITYVKTDGDNIYTSSLDNTIKIWDNDYNLIKTLNHEERVYMLQTDSEQIYSISADYKLTIWDKNGTIVKQIRLLEELYIPKLLVDDEYIYVSEGDTIIVREKETYNVVFNLTGYDTVETIKIDEKNIYSGDFSGSLNIWDKRSGKLINKLIFEDAVYVIDIGSKYIYVGTSESIEIYDKDTLNKKKSRYIISEKLIEDIRHDSENIYFAFMVVKYTNHFEFSGVFSVLKNLDGE